MKYLVTGAAGFIGMHVTLALLAQGHDVVGIDNLNPYYTPALKQYRLDQLAAYRHFKFVALDLADRQGMAQLFNAEAFQQVIHLAAQAGVRHSLTAPFDYVDSNLVGMMTVLEGCRHHKVEHLVFASSSSVYGLQQQVPFRETDCVDFPVSLYAATKKSCELMAHSYAHLYHLPITALRFFTVYGPAGRPDMAPWLFTEAILKGKPIKVFNQGKMKRDFTYIDDVIHSVVRIAQCVPCTDCGEAGTRAPYQLFNVGNHHPVELLDFIETIEQCCGRTAEKIFMPMQPGDVMQTHADVQRLEAATGYQPNTSIAQGIGRFVDWYLHDGEKFSC